MKKCMIIFLLCAGLSTHQLLQAQNKVPEKTLKALESAEKEMFDGIMRADMNYWKKAVHQDYITINADGVMQTKGEAMADSVHAKKMFTNTTYKLFDRKVRVYDRVGIITGRCQGFMGDNMIVEVYYTELWLNENGKWLFNGWQGTLSKNSPSMPPIE